ncbi:unnamed protein product [Nyctereutes procyonoides]|uniref:Nuclear nucleic acid-binding protein C1D n=1 Tax=Nyctereutes procyonoides TaxID=34880 RepID=A0A811ZW71_NYCPR|nr:unnamed protein product [Nyctereutes procyonoides]
MTGKEINEDYPVEIHEYLSTFENSIGTLDEMLKTMMSISRNELQKYFCLHLNSMFWVYLATQGVNSKEHLLMCSESFRVNIKLKFFLPILKKYVVKTIASPLDKGAFAKCFISFSN